MAEWRRGLEPLRVLSWARVAAAIFPTQEIERAAPVKVLSGYVAGRML